MIHISYESDLVHAEEHLVLRHHGVGRLAEDADEHVLVEGVEGDEGGEAAHELGDHPEVDQVGALHIREVPVPLGLQGLRSVRCETSTRCPIILSWTWGSIQLNLNRLFNRVFIVVWDTL